VRIPHRPTLSCRLHGITSSPWTVTLSWNIGESYSESMGEFRGKFPQEKIFTRAKSAGKKSGVEYPVNVREEIFREGGKGIFTEKYPHVWGCLGRCPVQIVCKQTSLYAQRLWFVPPWLTHTHTHTHTHKHWFRAPAELKCTRLYQVHRRRSSETHLIVRVVWFLMWNLI